MKKKPPYVLKEAE